MNNHGINVLNGSINVCPNFITEICPLCEREIPKSLMERHHIKTKEIDRHALIPICNGCHNFIHKLFTNRDIINGLNTVEALLNNEQFSRALKFIKKQPPTSSIRVKRAKRN